jgi:hypothetical protein
MTASSLFAFGVENMRIQAGQIQPDNAAHAAMPDHPSIRFDGLTFRPFDDDAEWDYVILGETISLGWLEACEACSRALWEEIERIALESARDDCLDRQAEERGNRRHFAGL